MKNKIQLILYAVLLLAAQSCRDDCPVEPDPCSEYPSEIEIEISTLNVLTLEDYLPTPDTIFTIPEQLLFSANYAYDSIFWQVGADPTIRKQESFAIRFEDNSLNKNITVFAKCHRPINNECFGLEDDGIDTLTQTITFKAREDSPIHGLWRGTNDGESDSFNVKIHRLWWTNSAGQTFYDGTRYTGLPKGTETSEKWRNTSVGWFTFTSKSELLRLDRTLNGRLQEDGTIKIYWKLWDNPTQRTFTGKRIE